MFTGKISPELVLQAKKGDLDALSKIEEGSRTLRQVYVKKFLFKEDLYNDGYQEAWSGVCRAIQGFDPSRNVPFLSYAKYHVWKSLNHFLNEMRFQVRRPTHMIGNIKRKTKQSHLAGHVRVRRYTAVLKAGASWGDVYLHDPLPHHSEGTWNDILPSNSEIPSSHSQTADEWSLIRRVLNDPHVLSGSERFILEARFGFHNGEPQGLKEIAQAIGVTKERVRQIIVEGITKIKRVLGGVVDSKTFLRNDIRLIKHVENFNQDLKYSMSDLAQLTFVQKSFL